MGGRAEVGAHGAAARLKFCYIRWLLSGSIGSRESFCHLWPVSMRADLALQQRAAPLIPYKIRFLGRAIRRDQFKYATVGVWEPQARLKDRNPPHDGLILRGVSKLRTHSDT